MAANKCKTSFIIFFGSQECEVYYDDFFTQGLATSRDKQLSEEEEGGGRGGGGG